MIEINIFTFSSGRDWNVLRETRKGKKIECQLGSFEEEKNQLISISIQECIAWTIATNWIMWFFSLVLSCPCQFDQESETRTGLGFNTGAICAKCTELISIGSLDKVHRQPEPNQTKTIQCKQIKWHFMCVIPSGSVSVSIFYDA